MSPSPTSRIWRASVRGRYPRVAPLVVLLGGQPRGQTAVGGVMIHHDAKCARYLVQNPPLPMAEQSTSAKSDREPVGAAPSSVRPRAEWGWYCCISVVVRSRVSTMVAEKLEGKVRPR